MSYKTVAYKGSKRKLLLNIEKRIKEEIKNLNLKRADVSISMPSKWRPSGFYLNGSVEIEAEWAYKPKVAAGGTVKRESSAGGGADAGGLGRRVRSRLDKQEYD